MLTLIYTTQGYISCGCIELAAGNVVDLPINITNIPTLPESIRGVVQTVTPTEVDGVEGRVYEIEYDETDLLTLITHLEPEEVDLPTCVSDYTLALEYMEDNYGTLPADVAAAIVTLDAAVAANRYTDHPSVDVASITSKSYFYTLAEEVVNPINSRAILLHLDSMFFSVIPELNGLADGTTFKLAVKASSTSSESANGKDSYIEAFYTGRINEGGTVFITFNEGNDDVTLNVVRSGEAVVVSCNNNSATNSQKMSVEATLNVLL